MSAYRLASGGRINRSHPISFKWAGRHLTGFEGDTLASALLANGIKIVGRSFKYHRPRGLLAAGLEEPNAIVQIGEGASSRANLKATEVTLTEGLIAKPVNAWPSTEFDLLSINSLFKRFIPAAFYYKTFTWPDWHLFEPFIRKAAGLGDAPARPDPDQYAHKFDHCETLIIGGGVAGLKAALDAAQAGQNLLLVEHNQELGGPYAIGIVDGEPAELWIERAIQKLKEFPNVKILRETTAIGYYDHGLVALVQRPLNGVPERFWKVRTQRTIFATGALERPFVFENNDLPGIQLASAALNYLQQFAISPGKEILIATNNDSAYQTALALKTANCGPVCILDARPRSLVSDRALEQAANLEIRFNTVPYRAKGSRRLKSVIPLTFGTDGGVDKQDHEIKCDALLVSSGWSPVVHLHSQAGGKLKYDARFATFVPTDSNLPIESVGAAAGELDRLGNIQPIWSVDVKNLDHASKSWVDFQNDVTAADVALAARENFQSVEHLKRYTTLGMATDQGKTSNINGLAIMGEILGKSPDQVGTTKFRPPYNPTTIGVFAGHRTGDLIHPEQRLAAHQMHAKLNAKFEDYGRWRRPAYYPFANEPEHEAVAREAKAVRQSLGIFDASSLGTIEVYGRDAAEFLDRIYAGTMSTLKPGKCRYGLMLNEHGLIFDDGVVARISDKHYLVGATSGNANLVASHLEEWLQCEWLDLVVATENVTTDWATMNLAGPRARTLLEQLTSTIDFSPEAFPHLGFRQGELLGTPCRIQRVSFSGELSYEISVPWTYGASVMKALLEYGKPYDITPFGIEALMTLRIEKGFLHVGSETDGTTLPQDLGYGRMISRKKKDFIGKRSTQRPDGLREDRRQMVGLRGLNDQTLPIGAHILNAGASAPGVTQGWVSSSAYSPNLGRGVALAMINSGRARSGEQVDVWHLGERYPAIICDPCQFDPKGERMNG